MRRRTALIGLVLLGGCQAVTSPFVKEDDAPDLTAPKDSLGIVVEAPSGVPDAAGHAIAESMADALQELEVPASTTSRNQHSYVLSGQGTMTPPTVAMTSAQIDWTLRDRVGKELGRSTEAVTLSTASWDKGDPLPLTAFAHQQAPIIAGYIREAAPVEHSLERHVFVQTRGNVPGDGAQMLPVALAMRLRLHKIDVTADPHQENTTTIAADVTLTSANAQQDHVKIVWHVLTPDGADAAQVTQENNVPKGSLSGRWGMVSGAIADAATDDLLKILDNIGAGKT